MKKILIITALFPPEPVVSAGISLDVAKVLSKKNDVTVISPLPSRPYGYKFTGTIENYDFKHIALKSYVYPKSKIIGRLRESVSFGIACYKYIIRNNIVYDSVYINTWPIFAQLITILGTRKYSKYTVIHVQDIYPEIVLNRFRMFSKIIYWILLPIDKYILKRANCIVTISEGMKDRIVKSRKIEPNTVNVVYNWNKEAEKNISANVDKCNQDNAKFTFMFLGNLNPTANIDFIINAFIKAELDNSLLVIAGDGSDKNRLMELSSNNKNIIFKHAPFDKIEKILRQSDVLIISLKKNTTGLSFPSKLITYMFSGKPIILCADEKSDISNTIILANCGWTIEPDKQAVLVALMKQIAITPICNLKDLGLNGKNYAVVNYSKINNLHKLISLISESI